MIPGLSRWVQCNPWSLSKKGVSEWERSGDNRSRVGEGVVTMLRCWLWRRRKEPWPWIQAASGSWGRWHTDSLLEPPERNSPADTLTLALWDWLWSSYSHDCWDTTFGLFKGTKFVVIVKGAIGNNQIRVLQNWSSKDPNLCPLPKATRSKQGYSLPLTTTSEFVMFQGARSDMQFIPTGK